MDILLTSSEEKKIVDFEKWMRKLIQGLQQNCRWGAGKKECETKIKDGVTVETITEHTLKMGFIVQLMLSLEKRLGNPHKLNFFFLLQCALNHDIEESINGDCLLPSKTEEDVKKSRQTHKQILNNGIPDCLRNFFPLPIDLIEGENVSQKHKEFWHACEELGYVWFVWEEICQGRYKYLEVFHKHLPSLKKMGEKYKSVGIVTHILENAIVGKLTELE